MNLPLRLITVCLLAFISSAAADAKNLFIEDTKKTVAFVFAPNAAKQFVPLGTGFFAGVKIPNTDRYYTYFVTARHVVAGAAGGIRNDVFLRLNKSDGGSEFVHLDTKIADKDAVFAHPSDPTVDLVAIPVFISRSKFDYKFIQDEVILTREARNSLEVGEGSNVFFTGLFRPFIGNGRNYPVVRSGTVALLTDERVPWQTDASKPPEMAELLLLETQSFGGNSGSPVFVTIPKKDTFGALQLRLLGIMRGTFEQGREISVVQNAAIAVAKQNLGIAAVVPSHLLYDILNGEPLNTFRRSLEAAAATAGQP